MVYPDRLHSFQIPTSIPLTSGYNLEDDYIICDFSKMDGQYFCYKMCIYPLITHNHFISHILDFFHLYEKNWDKILEEHNDK